MQLMMDFETSSPINVEKLSRQNRIVYAHLCTGETITVHVALHRYGILHLHSRISDLRNKHGIIIHGRRITVRSASGELSDVNEYSLTPFK